ncbi:MULTISPECIES: cupin domain-containing protein [unclassified Tenacibaculum]|uniref:cupin domain-containing protein n=1 Tax=unclassified Tenacibaculum TaxID=2635139 RepID=UPI00237AFDD5|nr:cupin domain-containing protein [Tenacibaculum sp. L6]MDE0535042.1 cupin domain-containing protein [Tenacibaculum sp. L6]
MKTAAFLENLEYNEEKVAVSLLLETDFSKEIRIVFKKNQVMKDHKAPYPIVVQVLKGNIDFGVNNEVKRLNSGDMISLEAKIIHNLTALEDSVVRLTLSKSDSVNRVKEV